MSMACAARLSLVPDSRAPLCRLGGSTLLIGHLVPPRASVRPGAMTSEAGAATWAQRVLTLGAKPRGCHLVTREIVAEVPEIANYEIGLLHLWLQHSSASLTVNENASPDVRADLNDALDRIVPESERYRHADEGPDDMPAHVKCSLMGAGLTLPIRKGSLALGTWQGIYLNEHRNYGGPRSIVVTIQGQPAAKPYGRSIAGR